jgi:hypothetical protein
LRSQNIKRAELKYPQISFHSRTIKEGIKKFSKDVLGIISQRERETACISRHPCVVSFVCHKISYFAKEEHSLHSVKFHREDFFRLEYSHSNWVAEKISLGAPEHFPSSYPNRYIFFRSLLTPYNTTIASKMLQKFTHKAWCEVIENKISLIGSNYSKISGVGLWDSDIYIHVVCKKNILEWINSWPVGISFRAEGVTRDILFKFISKIK